MKECGTEEWENTDTTRKHTRQRNPNTRTAPWYISTSLSVKYGICLKGLTEMSTGPTQPQKKKKKIKRKEQKGRDSCGENNAGLRAGEAAESSAAVRHQTNVCVDEIVHVALLEIVADGIFVDFGDEDHVLNSGALLLCLALPVWRLRSRCRGS